MERRRGIHAAERTSVNHPSRVVIAGGVFSLLVASSMAARHVKAEGEARNVLTFSDSAGEFRTLNANGEFDLHNPFFHELGTNGRACVTCHRPDEGWTVTPDGIRRRFEQTKGLDPIFRVNDGSNCEGADVSSLAKRRRAFSLLLERGVIRVGLTLPDDDAIEFVVDRVDDPYHCDAPANTLSLYRRPLPSTNLRFLSAVMWDGRESSSTTDILADLAHQADDATTGHAQATEHLSPKQVHQIVAFETGLYTAQSQVEHAGSLSASGAHGGPFALSHQPFFIGINDPVGLNPTGARFDEEAFSLFDAWSRQKGRGHDVRSRAREAIARGEELFNSKPITLSGVAGLNGATFGDVTLPESFQGTCTICHDTPNSGNHSVKAPLNIGLTDVSRRTPDMPLYTLRHKVTGATVQTTDPGRAMITGKWADIGKFKGPVLRGLSARAPYFHNGSAATLEDVVEFYDTRFNIGLTDEEKADLLAFLKAL
jgi:cytochrome c peroxidase